MKVLDLFSGIGGFTLGLERTGAFKTVAFCEIDEYATKVLNKNWPSVKVYGDVRDVTATRLRADGNFPDIITAGWPCQDISVSGQQKGIIEGERSSLWSECARLLGEIRPEYAIFENVTALVSSRKGEWFKHVLQEIHKIGYDAEWHCLPASEFGAHHHRDRVWIIAYPSGTRSASRLPGQDKREERYTSVIDYSYYQQLRREREGKWSAQSTVCRVVDGLPNRSHRLKCLGNGVVPVIPEIIGELIIRHKQLQLLS